MLHNEKDLFETAVLEASEAFNIAPVIIEKDYYVTLFLQEIIKRQPNIIFKGGTSLSKCYRLIKRFSEDIDLNLEGEQKPTQGQRRQLTDNIRDIVSDYGFELKNPDEIRSRRDFNRFEIDVHSLFSSEFIKHDLIVETSVFLRSYPSVRLTASSFIHDYLKSIGRNDIIEDYDLSPFDLQVQAVERTFIDKLFAICDYYLDGNTDEHSRHLYDLYKMAPIVSVNEDLKQLLLRVREERKEHKTCLSAQDGIILKDCLQEIIDHNVYQKDFESITVPLIFEDVLYTEVKDNLKKIADSELLS